MEYLITAKQSLAYHQEICFWAPYMYVMLLYGYSLWKDYVTNTFHRIFIASLNFIASCYPTFIAVSPKPKPKPNLNLTQSLNLKKGKKLQREKKKLKKPLLDSNWKTLCSNPTNCAIWQFLANTVVSLPFIAHHVNHVISQFFLDKLLLGDVI